MATTRDAAHSLHDVDELAKLVARVHELVRSLRVLSQLIHPPQLVAEQSRDAR